MEPAKLKALLTALRPVAEEAGRATLAFYGAAEARTKADGSPVTQADEASEAVILPHLRTLTPDIPVISEEEASKGLSPTVAGSRFWLVDPLDGTKEFLSGNGEFTVNIALIDQGVPVLGIVVAPALGETYWGAADAAFYADKDGARPIHVRPVPPEGLVVVGSRSHGNAQAMEEFLGGRKVAEFRPAGSSLKLCLVARGVADLYPRFGPTMEWDIAAGHAILRAAGGTVRTLEGAELCYGKPECRNPHFIAAGQEAPVH
ncbi:3'(2'),5'-bisphosphate nucleotidase CysQ [Aquabacter sp. L1I39]|uniref:3'(2'),5'-bisphosphate nucleotidase CysQ n=1 Tax=Aquabacter sp. L1I39 TaxID=2820278 RepID=UPI001ADBC1F5|nr:3'(2'),5'-bisphosphate nucleotidase CysQ [Aquabacter sp. L1I39]QTL05336.1 3'(2'),5'-bisphosphate nucleotidase CysQ [Aquabacter sp. L1I39]